MCFVNNFKILREHFPHVYLNKLTAALNTLVFRILFLSVVSNRFEYVIYTKLICL